MNQNINRKKEKRRPLGLILVALCVAVFALGFLSASVLYIYSGIATESPQSFRAENMTIAPHDIISEDKIQVYDDRVVIKVSGASLSSYAPTGSMKPLFDSGANGLRIVPNEESDIHIGDIISFKRGHDLIVHRVIEKGFDSSGIYFITQGDNNFLSDEKIRFKDIKFVTIGIIY